MACHINDREGESPSPTEPRLGRTFHSSATGRRREQTLPEAPGLRQAPHPRDDTAGSASSDARTTSSDAAHRTSIASPARTRDPNRLLTAYAATGNRPRTRPDSRSSGAPNRWKRAHRMMAPTRSSRTPTRRFGAWSAPPISHVRCSAWWRSREPYPASCIGGPASVRVASCRAAENSRIGAP